MTIEQDHLAYLRKIVDLTFGGVWVRFDDNVISIWFGPDWEKAVSAASEITEQNGWAFKHDKSQRCFYFGRAYPKQVADEWAQES